MALIHQGIFRVQRIITKMTFSDMCFSVSPQKADLGKLCLALFSQHNRGFHPSGPDIHMSTAVTRISCMEKKLSGIVVFASYCPSLDRGMFGGSEVCRGDGAEYEDDENIS
jgi:hypothetical protein